MLSIILHEEIDPRLLYPQLGGELRAWMKVAPVRATASGDFLVDQDWKREVKLEWIL